MVAALIADNGMAFISDGRVNDLDHKIINDEQVKLFELSPLAVVLPAGGASDMIDSLMTVFKGVFTTSGIVNVDDVAMHYLKYWQERITLEGEGYPVFTIAGYNLLPTGDYEPKIYVMQFLDGIWELGIPTNGEKFITIGSVISEPKAVLRDEYSRRSDASLLLRNKAALRALKVAEELKPEHVGGQTSLWNLKPGFAIRKFPQSEINRLKTRL